MNLSNTAARAIEAYGGADLWKTHKYVEAEVSAKGLAFTLKRRPFFEPARLKMEIARPYSILTPIGKLKGISGVLEGDRVRLLNERQEVLEERPNARQYFPFGRRLFFWDDLDMAYFANYAFWNYFTLPRLLMDEGIDWQEREEGVLWAKFPDSIPTHSKVQEFRFDPSSGLLKQHNYTADVISSLAKAANVVVQHQKNDQLQFPSARIVSPQFGNGNALGFPVLIDIKVHSFKLTN